MGQMRILQESDFQAGADNMAIDVAVAEAVAAGLQLPTLRLYGWNPFCLSLGYGQRVGDADRRALRERGWDLLRRPTGGKAILHGDELTYSLCLPLDHRLARGDVISSYRRLSGGLLRALERLGLSAAAKPKDTGASQADAGPVCFEMPSHYEITVAGKKLIGSAQMRRQGTLLQHGTLPLRGDVARICDVLTYESEEARALGRQSLRQRATTLAQATGRELAWSEVATALAGGCAREYELEALPGLLSEFEAKRAEELAAARFRNPEWTDKR